MAGLDSDDLVNEIKKFIEEQERNGQHTSSETADTHPEQPSGDVHTPRVQVTVNYKDFHGKFNLDDVSPSVIKREFDIEGTLQLERRNIIHKETEDDDFEPPLVRGKYTLTVIPPRHKNVPPPRRNRPITGPATEHNDDM